MTETIDTINTKLDQLGQEESAELNLALGILTLLQAAQRQNPTGGLSQEQADSIGAKLQSHIDAVKAAEAQLQPPPVDPTPPAPIPAPEPIPPADTGAQASSG